MYSIEKLVIINIHTVKYHTYTGYRFIVLRICL